MERSKDKARADALLQRATRIQEMDRRERREYERSVRQVGTPETMEPCKNCGGDAVFEYFNGFVSVRCNGCTQSTACCCIEEDHIGGSCVGAHDKVKYDWHVMNRVELEPIDRGPVTQYDELYRK